MTKFAEWLAENHYRLHNVIRDSLGEKVYLWSNEDGVKTSEDLFKEYENELNND